MASTDFALVRSGFSLLYASKDLSDLTITCGDYEEKVHKAIVAAQSNVLKNMLLVPSKSTLGTSNARRDSIDLPARKPDSGVHISENEVDAVKAMVHFLYHFDYSVDAVDLADSRSDTDEADQQPAQKRARIGLEKQVITLGADGRRASTSSPVFGSSTQLASTHIMKNTTRPKPTGDINMVMHAKVFACAVKYDVKALQILSAQKFDAAVAMNADHVSFAEAIKVVYATTPADVANLRNTIVKTLDRRDELLDRDDVEMTVRSINELSFDLLKLKRKNRRPSSFASLAQRA